MRSRFLNWSIAALLMTTTALPMSAEARGRGGEGRGPSAERRLFRQLDLTEEQRTKLAELRKEKSAKMESLRKQMKAAHEKMKAALEADSSDEALKKAHQEVRDVRAQLEDMRFESMLAIRKVLTPEQRKKFADLKQKGPQRGKGRMAQDQDEE